MPNCAQYEIASIRPLNETAFEIIIDAAGLCAESLPGQFVHIRCGEKSLLRRPISVCDVAGDRMRLVVDVRGEGTKWLSQRQAGQTLDVLGPLGHGFALPESDKPALLVGGGVGAPPLLYAAKEWMKKNRGRAHAILGFRSRSAVMLVEDFQSACGDVIVTTDDGTLGRRGLVDAPLREKLESGRFACILACGPKPMLKAAARLAEEIGIPCQVSMEEKMGCGVGACLVCACRTRREGVETYSHVCKDGPVFDAAEVCWDE